MNTISFILLLNVYKNKGGKIEIKIVMTFEQITILQIHDKIFH